MTEPFLPIPRALLKPRELENLALVDEGAPLDPALHSRVLNLLPNSDDPKLSLYGAGARVLRPVFSDAVSKLRELYLQTYLVSPVSWLLPSGVTSRPVLLACLGLEVTFVVVVGCSRVVWAGCAGVEVQLEGGAVAPFRWREASLG